MKKEDKEKRIYELRLKEIQSIDKDITKLYFVFLAGWGGIFFYLFKTNSLSPYFFILLLSLFVIFWAFTQYNSYVIDCYEWLCITMNNNNLLEESIPMMKIRHAIYYSPKYKKDCLRL